jgi:hypothetical protein
VHLGERFAADLQIEEAAMKAMTGLTEKLVMTAIILSCGLVAHTDQSGRNHQQKRTTTGTTHTWLVLPAAAHTAHTAHAARLVKAAAARGNMP